MMKMYTKNKTKSHVNASDILPKFHWYDTLLSLTEQRIWIIGLNEQRISSVSYFKSAK